MARLDQAIDFNQKHSFIIDYEADLFYYVFVANNKVIGCLESDNNNLNMPPPTLFQNSEFSVCTTI
jgi:hypothetical protein